VTAPLWSPIDGRRTVLDDRAVALDLLGIDDVSGWAALCEELELLAALAREHRDEAIAARKSREVAVVGQVGRHVEWARTHMGAAPADLRAVAGHLRHGTRTDRGGGPVSIPEPVWTEADAAELSVLVWALAGSSTSTVTVRVRMVERRERRKKP
jgi:hypothetical protein